MKEPHNPKAYLESIRNTERGLHARTKILASLENVPDKAGAIAMKCGVLYGVVMHHLKLLETECIVQRTGRKPYVWKLTGRGQRRLVSSG